MKKALLVLITFVWAVALRAEKASVKLQDVDTKEDTAIIIKKGPLPASKECVSYDILEGREEIFGTPEYDKTKARAHFATACEAWKKEMKEMNKDNQILSLNCNSPHDEKEGEMHLFKSFGTYRMKVKMREPKQQEE